MVLEEWKKHADARMHTAIAIDISTKTVLLLVLRLLRLLEHPTCHDLNEAIDVFYGS